MKKIKSFPRKNAAKRGAFFLLFLFSVSFFAGCTKETEPIESSSSGLVGWPVTVEGTEISEPPTRIASLSPALTEMLFEFGLGSKVVGVSNYCNYPEAAIDLPKVGTAWEVDMTTIQNIKPEYLLVQSPLSADITTAIENTGTKVVVLLPGSGIDSVENLYQQLFYLGYGTREGQQKADIFLDEFESTLETVKNNIPDKGYSAAYLISIPESAATGDTFENNILTELNLKNVAADSTLWAFPDASLVTADPDILIVSTDTDIEAFKTNDAHKNMKAVKNNQIYPADQIVFERQTPRMAEEIEILAKAIYGNEYGTVTPISSLDDASQ